MTNDIYKEYSTKWFEVFINGKLLYEGNDWERAFDNYATFHGDNITSKRAYEEMRLRGMK